MSLHENSPAIFPEAKPEKSQLGSAKTKYTRQTEIQEFPLFQKDLIRLENTLNLCGKIAKVNFYCKKDPTHEHLLETRQHAFYCKIRYCNCPRCAIERFRDTVETFKEIERFWNLIFLWHFSIGFEAIPELEFKKNFSKYKKRFECVLNKYFEKLRKAGIQIQGIRVLDFSFVTEGMVYLHYHFACLPVGSQRIRSVLVTMQQTRKQMIKSQKIKTPFIVKDYGLAKKTAVLSYLAIRSAGMYKYEMTKNTNYKHIQCDLLESIKHDKYIFLSNVLTKEEYLKSFYNKPHFVTIGGLPRPPRHGSNISDAIPNHCPIHGHLERKDVRVEVIFDSIEQTEVIPPPDSIKTYPELEIEVIKIG